MKIVIEVNTNDDKAEIDMLARSHGWNGEGDPEEFISTYFSERFYNLIEDQYINQVREDNFGKTKEYITNMQNIEKTNLNKIVKVEVSIEP